jgi:hypothetical protein
MTLTQSAREIYASIKMEMILKMKRDTKNDDVLYDALLKGEDRYKQKVWSFLNSDGYMDEWIEKFAVPETKKVLDAAEYDNVFTVEKKFPIWKVMFAETMLYDVDKKPVTLEPFQKDILLNPSNKQAWCLSRRTGKSFLCHTDATAYAVCRPPTYSIIILQSWDTAKEALDEISDWFNRNPLLSKFTGGFIRNQATNKAWKNGSRISCRTATKPEKMRSKNPDRIYEDEKAFYPKGTAELSTMRIGHSLKRQARQARLVMSSPNGTDNEFERILDDKLNPGYYTVEIPVCSEIIWDDEKKTTGIKRPIDFKDIVSNRITKEDLISQWNELGQTVFMQDYMLERTSYEGAAIPKWLIEMFFDYNMESKMESNQPCIISFDLGTSENHRSTIGVGEVRTDGTLNIIRLMTFPMDTPFWRGFVDGIEYDGVFNTVLSWCNLYNVYKIIGDATSMSSKQEMMQFTEAAEKMNISPANIIPYQWSRQSNLYMGKAPLYQSLVRPAIEKGRVRCIFNKQLEHEMQSWQGRKTDSGNVVYTPLRPSDRDDLWTMVMQMMYAHFYEGFGNQPMPEIKSLKTGFPRSSENYKSHKTSKSVRSHRSKYRRRR